MAKKKKQSEERKPDLASPDQDVIEEKIKNMLDVNEPDNKDDTPEEKPDSAEQAKSKKVEVQFDEVGSAPELPGETKVTTEAEETKKDNDEADEDEDYEEKPEKIVNLDDAPKEESLLEEMQNKAQESLEKKEPKKTDKTKDISEEVELNEPLLEDESAPQSEESDENKEIGPENEVETTKIPTAASLGLESQETSKAVDDIVAKEGDALLDVEDEKFKHVPKKEKKNNTPKQGGFLRSWWNNPKARTTAIIVCLALLALVAIVPISRYFVLNTLGFRANASVTVLDESTGQPLKNVKVTISSASAKTDSTGTAQLDDVKLGSTELKVEKIAFAPGSEKVTISLGSNNLENVMIKPIGEQYSFVVTDYLSGKPVSKIEAISGESSAFSDSAGKIKLTVDPGGQESLDVKFVGQDYREEKITIPTTNNTETNVVITPSKKHVFISKKNGKYDLYSIDVDGKNEKLLLSGTGYERDDVAFSYNPSANFAALVSTRDNKKNNEGVLLSNLNVIAVGSGESKAVASSENVQLIDWIGDRLIFVQVVSGASSDDPARHKLMSYDSKSNQTTEIAFSNYFNDIVVAGEKIYFAPSSAHQKNAAALYRVEADGSGKVTILNQEIWNIFRIDYENLALYAQGTWFNVKIGEDKASSLSVQPANPESRLYADSPDKKSSLWVDDHDGKGVLLNYQVSSRDDLTIVTANGVRWPASWLNKKDVVYRVSNEQETADYAVSLTGGEPKKITDVTNTNSLNQWYHY